MFSIWLPPIAKRGIRLWLQGREAVIGIGHVRFSQFLSEEADTIFGDELMKIIDATGYGVLDAMLGRQVSRR